MGNIIIEANEKQKSFYKKQNDIKMEIHHIEQKRLRLLQDCLINTSRKCKHLLFNADLQTMMRDLTHNIDNLVVKSELQSFYIMAKKKSGVYLQPQDFSYDIPEWKNALYSLDDAMQITKKRHPEMRIPLILKSLCDALKRAGGFSTDGIFRIWGDKKRCNDLK